MVSRINLFGLAIPCLKHFQNVVFGTVPLRKGLLCRADDYLPNFNCAALRAMTGPERQSAIRLFVIIIHLLKLCGAIQNFTFFPKALPMGWVRPELL